MVKFLRFGWFDFLLLRGFNWNLTMKCTMWQCHYSIVWAGSLPVHEPIICVGFLSHVLCRVPLIPCYMDGSEHPTVPHRFARSSKVRFGRADRQIGTGDGSKLYEVNMWLWKFGRGMPRSRTVSESERLRSSYAAMIKSKGHNTRKRRQALE